MSLLVPFYIDAGDRPAKAGKGLQGSTGISADQHSRRYHCRPSLEMGSFTGISGPLEGGRRGVTTEPRKPHQAVFGLL